MQRLAYAVKGIPGLPDALLEPVHRRSQSIQALLADAHGLGHLRQAVFQKIHSIGYGVQNAFAVPGERLHAVQGIRQSVCGVVDGGDIAVRPAAHGIGKLVGIVKSGLGITGKLVQTAENGIPAAVSMVQCVLHHIVQQAQGVFQLLNGILSENQANIGGDLAGHTAHILAAQHGAAVHAVFQISGGTAHYAAHIIAHMGIADGAFVPAVPQHTVGGAGDTSGIRGGVQHFFGIQVVQAFFQTLFLFLVDRVDGALVDAAGDDAAVLAGDTAGVLFAGDRAHHRAAVDGAGGFVDPGDTAHLALPLYGATEGTGQDGAFVAAGDTAQAGLFPGGGDGAGHMEVPDHSALLDIAEQPLVRGAVCQGEAGNGVPISLKGPAEGRYG